MLDADVKIVDLGGENVSRLFGILTGAVPHGPTGTLVVIHRGYRVLRAIDLDRREPVEIEFGGTAGLDLLATRYGYRHVIALEESAATRIFGHAQRAMHYRDDYLKQWYGFARGLALEWRRTVYTYPWCPRRFPLPPYGLITAALRLLMPRDTICLLAVTEHDRAWASLAFGWRNGDVWLLTSLDAIDMEEGDLGGSGFHKAARDIQGLFGSKVRAAAIEHVALERALASQHPTATLVRSHATGELRLHRFPLRWMAFWLTLFAARARITKSLFHSGVRYYSESEQDG
ncbi:MAG: hypothetical protein KKF41_04870 [Actinobacteria bacterium]|nr:hypothetical protein [Actinomycetota bacterium]MBU1943016.1 hypothetical protein [Actinomycetota bacterium]MBU2686898.1 hypothetical protein [Actinomycetota bacterium]